nr:hypothetical protein StreXyl84_62430 [Streptomyces sp. Xyl84]
MIAAGNRRRAWACAWSVVLAVMVHLVGCAHGPLASAAGRVDSLGIQGAGAAPPSPSTAQVVSPGTAQVVAGDGECERHHGGTHACVGLDQPVVAQAEPGKALPPPCDVPRCGADERPGFVRGPPSGEAVAPGAARARAVLQVWRN